LGARAAQPHRSTQRGERMYSIHLEKSTAHAVSPVRKTRLLYFDRRRGVWLQARSWNAAQAGRHALDRQGRQRHHRPALQQAQRTLPGFLGTPLRAKAGGCMTSLNLMCAHWAPLFDGDSRWLLIPVAWITCELRNRTINALNGPGVRTRRQSFMSATPH